MESSIQYNLRAQKASKVYIEYGISHMRDSTYVLPQRARILHIMEIHALKEVLLINILSQKARILHSAEEFALWAVRLYIPK